MLTINKDPFYTYTSHHTIFLLSEQINKVSTHNLLCIKRELGTEKSNKNGIPGVWFNTIKVVTYGVTVIVKYLSPNVTQLKHPL